MNGSDHPPVNRGDDDGFVRLGGAAVLLAIAIHIVVNWILKELPSTSLTPAELQAYFSEQFDTWAVVHGARYVAVVAIVLFYTALFVRTYDRGGASKGWGLVGLIGSAMLATNLMITNGLETLAYLNIELLRENQELFWLLRNVTRTLFTGEIVTWVLAIIGFSMAGWYSGTIPRWIVVLGCASAASGMLSVTLLVDSLTNGWTAIFADVITPLTAIAWFASVGIVMLRRGAE